MNNISTPTLSRVIKEAVESRLLELHVCLPGKVEKYHKDKQKADIQPLLQRKFKTDEQVNLPLITNVPVIWPSANNNQAYITLPLKKDDTGIITFAERSLDLWLVKGGMVAPEDTRKHDLSDGIFIPGLNPFTNPIQNISEENIVIKNKDAKIEIKPDGSIILIGNRKLIDERLINFFNAHTHSGGTSGPPDSLLTESSVTTTKVTAE